MSTTPTPLKFLPYAPDAAPYNTGVTDVLENVIPLDDGYGPFPLWVKFGTGLGGQCKGAVAVRKSAGTTDIYAGTTTGLYKFVAATSSWTAVTRSSGGAYAVPSDGYWCFTLFGKYLIATNGVDDNQYIDVDAGTNFAALPNSPKAYYCCAVGDFLWLGRLASDGRAYAWSGINDITYWTPGYRGSDQQTAPSGGIVRGLAAIGKSALIFLDDDALFAERIGGNVGYRIAPVGSGIGCYAPASIVTVRENVFWYANGGFFSGIKAEPIGYLKVNEFVRAQASANGLRTMSGTSDPDRNMVWWSMTTTGGTKFLIGYNWATKLWTRVAADIDIMFPSISPGYTLGDWGTLGYTFATLPYTFDSAFWVGSGIRQMAGFNTAGEFGYFQGASMAASLETTDLNFDSRMSVFTNGFRVEGDVPVASLTGALRGKKHHGSGYSAWTSDRAANATTGLISIRKRDRLLRFKVNIASSEWTRTSGIIANLRGAGRL